MIYINPYFANLTGDPSITRNLFQEGDENGFFVRNLDNTSYLMYSVSMEFAMVDLNNPMAIEWIKHVIADNLITEASAYGWMLDFGEYTPFDATTLNGMPAELFHNQYPYLWAKINREVYSNFTQGDQLVAFMRAGSTMSPAYTDLYWMGD
jgi:alpha-glucosidase